MSEGERSAPTPVPVAASPETSVARLRVVSLALAWGLGIGAGLGALAGTLVVPLFGTLYGLVLGLGVAAAPTVVGAAALYLSARPGTSPEAFRRRVRVVLTTIGLLVVAVGVPLVLFRIDDSATTPDLFGGPVLLGCLLAPYLLLWAHRSIAAVEPAPAGVRDRSGIGLLLVVALLVGGICGRVAWTNLLGPDARALRAVEAERDRIADRIGVGSVGDGTSTHSTREDLCTGDGEGRISDGYADLGPGGADDAVARAAEVLADAGYQVTTGLSPGRFDEDPLPWAYGIKADASATVETSRDSVFVAVTHGCRNRRPTAAVEELPAELLAASLVGIDPDQVVSSSYGRLTCDTRGTEQVQVAVAVPLDLGGSLTDTTWRVTTGSGEAATTSCVERISQHLLAIGDLPGDPADPPVRVELVDPGRTEALAALPEDARAVDVAPIGDGARLVRAELVEVPVIGDDRGEGCPDDVAFGVRVLWDRAVDAYDMGGAAYGRRRAGLYRVTVAVDGEAVEVRPTVLAEVDDPDNSHLLCIATDGIPTEVRVDASDALSMQQQPTQAGSVGVLLR